MRYGRPTFDIDALVRDLKPYAINWEETVHAEQCVEFLDKYVKDRVKDYAYSISIEELKKSIYALKGFLIVIKAQEDMKAAESEFYLKPPPLLLEQEE